MDIPGSPEGRWNWFSFVSMQWAILTNAEEEKKVGEQQRSVAEQDPVVQEANNMEAMMHDAAAIGEVIVSPSPKQTSIAAIELFDRPLSKLKMDSIKDVVGHVTPKKAKATGKEQDHTSRRL